jgi:hypothetical protein
MNGIKVEGTVGITIDDREIWQLCTDVNNCYFMCWMLYRRGDDGILVPVGERDGAGNELEVYPNNWMGQVKKTPKEMSDYLIPILEHRRKICHD